MRNVFTNRLASICAALGLLTVSAAFLLSMFSFRGATLRSAAHSLQSRVQRMSSVVVSAVETQDFPALHRLGDECREAGERLVVKTGAGGVLYDNRAFEVPERETLWVSQPAGGFAFSLSIRREQALAPYTAAQPLFALAFLVGLVGMVFVFVAFFRQRAKIAALARLERERYEFITDFTHQLKTPLTGIIAAADMLEENRLVKVIRDSAHRLDRLAQELIYVYWGRH